MKILYMAVTPDKYELPLFVGDSKEVSIYGGISLNGLYSMVSIGRSGSRSGRKFVKVELDNDPLYE